MERIIFICHGNICRSPMGEYILKHMVKERGIDGEFSIASAAISDEERGNPVYPPAQRKLERMGIDAPPRHARKITRADYDSYDLILCMENYHVDAVKRICGGDPDGKVMRLLDVTDRPGTIADPWFTDDFDTAYDQIKFGCEAVLRRLGYDK